MQRFSYHTHTDFSDGKNTFEEMLQQAVKLGWEEIGISDHLIVHKNIKQSLSWSRWVENDKLSLFHSDFKSVYEPFLRHVEHIRKASRGCDIKVRIGAEVDFFTYDGWQEQFIEFYKQVGLDYCISGNHFLPLENEEHILDAKDSALLNAETLEASLQNHFQIIAAAAASGIFAFIAHLDYMRKIPECKADKFTAEKNLIVKALQSTKTGVELSTKGIRKQGHFYPDDNLLKALLAAKIPVVISDDAHRIQELGDKFAEAEEYLREAGCCSRWLYQK